MEFIEGFLIPFYWFIELFSPTALKLIGLMIGLVLFVTIAFFCAVVFVGLIIMVMEDN